MHKRLNSNLEERRVETPVSSRVPARLPFCRNHRVPVCCVSSSARALTQTLSHQHVQNLFSILLALHIVVFYICHHWTICVAHEILTFGYFFSLNILLFVLLQLPQYFPLYSPPRCPPLTSIPQCCSCPWAMYTRSFTVPPFLSTPPSFTAISLYHVLCLWFYFGR